MAIPVNITNRPSRTVYVALRRAEDGYYFHWVNNAFASYVDFTWSDFALAVTETVVPGLYSTSIDPVDVGTYVIEAFDQAGGGPNKTNDLVINLYELFYDGSQEVSFNVAITNLLAAIEGINNNIEVSGGGLTDEQDQLLRYIASRLRSNNNRGGINSAG